MGGGESSRNQTVKTITNIPGHATSCNIYCSGRFWVIRCLPGKRLGEVNTLLDQAQNDLIDEAVRCQVSTCASLYEICGNKHTTKNNRKNESTKRDRLRMLSTLE